MKNGLVAYILSISAIVVLAIARPEPLYVVSTILWSWDWAYASLGWLLITGSAPFIVLAYAVRAKTPQRLVEGWHQFLWMLAPISLGIDLVFPSVAFIILSGVGFFAVGIRLHVFNPLALALFKQKYEDARLNMLEQALAASEQEAEANAPAA